MGKSSGVAAVNLNQAQGFSRAGAEGPLLLRVGLRLHCLSDREA